MLLFDKALRLRNVVRCGTGKNRWRLPSEKATASVKMSKSGTTLVLATAVWEARRLLAGWPEPADENIALLRDELIRTLSTPEVDDVPHDIAAGDEREPNLDEPLANPPTGNRTLDGTRVISFSDRR